MLRGHQGKWYCREIVWAVSEISTVRILLVSDVYFYMENAGEECL
jgi:hypothetical protein